MSETKETPVIETLVTEPVIEVTKEVTEPINSIDENGNAVVDDKKTETTEEIKKEETAKKDPVSAKFAALTREAKKIQKDKAEAQTIIDNAKKLQTAMDEYKDDPEKLLAAAGWTTETYLEKITKGKTPLSVVQKQDKSEAEKRIERLEQELDNNKKIQEQKEFQADLTTFKRGVTDMVKTKSDDFELLNQLEDPAQDIFEYIYLKKDKEGVEVSPEDAAAAIEAYLQGDADEKLNKLSKTKKYKSRFTNEPEAPASDKKNEPTVKGSKTLSAEIPLAPTTSGKPLSYEESLKETIKAHYKPTKK